MTAEAMSDGPGAGVGLHGRLITCVHVSACVGGWLAGEVHVPAYKTIRREKGGELKSCVYVHCIR